MSLAGLVRRPVRIPERAEPGTVVMSAQDVALSFGGVAVLDGVDVEVRAGEVLALVGPNGAGKSTLLSVLAGDLSPTRGSVTIDGAPLSEWSTVELAMRRAVLLQQVGLSFPFTVVQSVRMGRAPWAGLDAEELDDEIVYDALVDTDVLQFADRVFMSLSGGERARAALARVLAQQSPVLLLDEPTAALDIRHQEQVLDLARRQAERGDAVVVVLHDLGLAAAHADRVVVLSRGGVAAQGPPEVVMTEELLGDVYECEVDIVTNPRSGELIIVPRRSVRR
ncbi:MAG: heme ABC transporter ATP-binding protein [Actinomycetota bacterium]|nr:heme ABC transporter ATP-binding protein [Actinomycetota bacterium]